ncbi:hypothetical protein GJ496_000102 [Pomphorhynchus laevis]|nr:hypothetical protein GJ496_000102 [Pomphorhynchus laevis]
MHKIQLIVLAILLPTLKSIPLANENNSSTIVAKDGIDHGTNTDNQKSGSQWHDESHQEFTHHLNHNMSDVGAYLYYPHEYQLGPFADSSEEKFYRIMNYISIMQRKNNKSAQNDQNIVRKPRGGRKTTAKTTTSKPNEVETTTEFEYGDYEREIASMIRI